MEYKGPERPDLLLQNCSAKQELLLPHLQPAEAGMHILSFFI